jgi:hypothetical protein
MPIGTLDYRTGTIGPGWSSDPIVKTRQMADQIELVGEMASLMQEFDEWDLEDFARERRRNQPNEHD